MEKLKIFNITYTETAYYLTKEIQAKNKEEAREKFYELFEGGEITVSNTECKSLIIKQKKD
jgi:ribosomal protein L20A (L18A)